MKFAIEELPLGVVFPDDEYNAHLCKAIAAMETKQPELAEIKAIEEKREAIWNRIQELKDKGMRGFAQHVSTQYQFQLRDDGALNYPWQDCDFVRVPGTSQFYTCHPETKAFEARDLDHDRPKVILFATGRAFAQRNARLLHLTTEESIQNACGIMSAQIHLLRSRLIPQKDGQLLAYAYDMVKSEFETPALRLQSILDPDFIHEGAKRSAERVFGPLIAEAEFDRAGRFKRENGVIVGEKRSSEDMLKRIQNTVLVGGSVGCVIVGQATRHLVSLLEELKVDSETVDEVMKSLTICNFGPTTHIPIDSRINYLAFINRHDEFVYAGHNTGPYLKESKATNSILISHDSPENAKESRHWTALIEGPGVSFPGADGELVFDPDATHFGHNMKQYMNILKERGFQALFSDILGQPKSYCLGASLDALIQSNKLDVTPKPDAI
ncbi:MAG: hypothetical protein P1V97_18835 [Planctomycetota bacterium]|nr:hypothetical protein [Planctomycetota bacterium]